MGGAALGHLDLCLGNIRVVFMGWQWVTQMDFLMIVMVLGQRNFDIGMLNVDLGWQHWRQNFICELKVEEIHINFQIKLFSYQTFLLAFEASACASLSGFHPFSLSTDVVHYAACNKDHKRYTPVLPHCSFSTKSSWLCYNYCMTDLFVYCQEPGTNTF